MTTVAPTKTCRVCGKDVSHEKRVKDAKGHYYCEPCHAAGRKAATAKAADAADTHAGLCLLDEEPVLVEEVREAAPARPVPVPEAPAAAPSRSAPLPKNCPACGALVIAGRRNCVKCKRDLTKPYKVAAESGPSSGEKIGNLIGTLMRIAVAVFVLAILAGGGWAIWAWVHPDKPFSEFPTTRAEAVKQFLGHVAKGNEKGYENAMLLVSFRERAGHDPDHKKLWRSKFIQIHDEFKRKYGDNWVSRLKVRPPESLGASGFGSDEQTPVEVVIDKDVYYFVTQVQIPMDDATMNMLSRNPQSYPEDGKNRFGISDIVGYSVRETRHVPKPMFQ